MRRPIIAVTGSSGKTSTKEMIASILQRRWKTFKSVKNGNDTWFTSQYKKKINSSHQAVVLEFGMRALGQIKRHCQLIRPNLGIITNVGRAHIGKFTNGLHGIAKAKSELITGMKPTGILFLNRDDKQSRLLNVKRFKGKMITVGIHSQADFRAERIRYVRQGMKFNVRLDNNNHSFFVPCFGICNVYNALFAIAVSHRLGCTVSQIKTGLKKMEKPYARLSVQRTRNKITIINDSFNTKPELEPAMDVLLHAGSAKGRKIAVLGDIQDLGKYARAIHLKQGRKLGNKRLDLLYTFGVHSRYLGIGAIQSGFSPKKVKHFTKIASLKSALAQRLQTGNTILLKGSTNGHKVKLMHLAEWLIHKAQ
ncbi:UDP-N-acetylmuramoyl-tripeptide--D-alanyl-D-alanine ligase [Paenibacillus algorifonticola]|uniref:UDP-N-acetylmuramoyl-tripeptide--D-alanyl-D-alanine ligase n=1 Tax=Paenibacillus algorifonticola TaxID=684063 RepID=A0A1I1ZSQ5_9BACL|nr:UDP-N-acetylmuramoyl-tripeptide--D-alanyl-D-alanine ligase [Paenibacillus algorifonticola]SFE33510.1 UDP-N-acetylmuramoyl-tripeptide--D-alanyl-D-alanine ligase [Paenibacillus algorifonticola]